MAEQLFALERVRTLCEQAESVLESSDEDLAEMSPAAIRGLVSELRAHLLQLNGTLHQRRTEALASAEDEWKKTFDAVPDLIMIVDQEYRILCANRAMADRLGCSTDECRGLECY